MPSAQLVVAIVMCNKCSRHGYNDADRSLICVKVSVISVLEKENLVVVEKTKSYSPLPAEHGNLEYSDSYLNANRKITC